MKQLVGENLVLLIWYYVESTAAITHSPNNSIAAGA